MEIVNGILKHVDEKDIHNGQVIIPCEVSIIDKEAFLNNHAIKTIIIPNNMTEFRDSAFYGCKNLENIIYKGKNKIIIGKKCFSNCHSLTKVPNFIANYNDFAFNNCISLKEVDIISKTIPLACFKGCKNLNKINNAEEIEKLSSYAFTDSGIEEITLHNITKIAPEAFSNCKKLKRVNLDWNVKEIGTKAFYNCSNLCFINLPDTIEKIGNKAFINCHSISEIIIPANLKFIGDGAFAWMNSLKKISVSPQNKIFVSPDNKILIDAQKEKLIFYASGLEDEEYSLNDYCYQIDMFNHDIIRPIRYIGEYAFAGSKNLKKLTISSCVDELEYTAFIDCPNLTILEINGIPLYSAHGFKLRNRGRYFIDDQSIIPFSIPFKKVIYSDIKQIFSNALPKFENVSEIVLPKSCNIGGMAFYDCKNLKPTFIHENIYEIGNHAFADNIFLTFENGIKTNLLVSKHHYQDYFGDYYLYELKDGTYYIDKDGEIITVTRDMINEVCTHPEVIIKDPVLYIDYINYLLDNNFVKKYLLDGNLIKMLNRNNRQQFFNSVDINDKFFEEVFVKSGIIEKIDDKFRPMLNERFGELLEFVEFLRRKNIKDEILFNKYFMTFCHLDEFEKLIDYDKDLLLKVVRASNLVSNDSKMTEDILSNNSLIDFLKLIKKYDVKDQFLFNKTFISTSNNPLLDKLFSVYDANLKIALKKSHVLDREDTSKQNLNDLLNLFEITGALSKDPIERQRATTFIIEKIFDEKFENGKTNPHHIVGNDIHRIFNFRIIRDEFDQEFAEFFLENFDELYKMEKVKSGFIERVYLNFRIISKTCTSNNGSQRKLKVTMDKCINYLSNTKFDGVTDENKDFAKLIGQWYDFNDSWIKAQIIHKESLKAPRNIFTKRKELKDGSITFDNSPNCDLRERISPDFSYEWLPKQDYDNLILGKYCNCCAHIDGAGSGIMRASMILDCCQNMVIRDDKGEIISKATIYVNREQGYGVFNTIETSLNHRSAKEIYKIYKAFMRGTKAFLEKYNQNNPDQMIEKITIGANRNTILEMLNCELHPEIDIHQALEFNKYSLDKRHYTGDWQIKQKLIIKK